MKRTGDPASWRSFIALSGAFPKDLTDFQVGEHEHPRRDLQWWRSQLEEGSERTATFGDYVTQHPLYSDPPRWANFSASIRYTAGDYWVIMRGEGVFTDDGPGYAQWPANAQLLSAREEFCGPGFSEGDRYIETMGAQMAKTGNAETWLRAGLNHHLVFTARQIAKLTGT